MSKYKDVSGVGRSRAVPFLKDETAQDRHARRKAHNFGLRQETEIFCEQNGIRLQIKNKGHHWIARKEKTIIEWWPSSAKVVINKNWKRGVHVHDAYQFHTLLEKEFCKS